MMHELHSMLLNLGKMFFWMKVVKIESI